MAPTGGISVDFATSSLTATSGSDFSATSGTLTFFEGESTGFITVPVTVDATFEPTERFIVTLSNPTSGTLSDATGEGTISNTLITSALEVDQFLNGTKGFSIIEPSGTANDFLGFAVTAGDVNGDSIPDLIIGVGNADAPTNDEGQVVVVFGGSGVGSSGTIDPSSLTGSNGFIINGASQDDFAGRSVAVGDINGDGVADIIIGAEGGDPGGDSAAGETYVIFGRDVSSQGDFASTINLSSLGSSGFIINGIDPADVSGTPVGIAGDVNYDGITDLLIGAPLADPGSNSAAGEAYLVFGSTSIGSSGNIELSSLNGTNGIIFTGKEASDQAGQSVAGIGDINDDGIADFAIGAPQAQTGTPTNSQGQTYVFFGVDSTQGGSLSSGGTVSLSSLNGSNGFVLNGAANSDYAGFSVSSAGDINGDGINDLLIGAPLAEDSNGSGGVEEGETYVVFGNFGIGSTGSIDLGSLSGSDGFVLVGLGQNEESGNRVSAAGDVNGDGFDDLLIGAQKASTPNNSSAGEVSIVFGGSSVGASGTFQLSSIDGINGFTLQGNSGSDALGSSIAAAGDINQDGTADIIVGAINAQPTGSSNNVGEAYVIFGSSSIANTTLPVFNLADVDGTIGFVVNGITDEDESGKSVTNLDFNGDGFSDLLIGAPNAEESTQSREGETYIVFGGAGLRGTASVSLSTLNGADGVRITGEAQDDFSGASVASAGDINNDGTPDIIIGSTGLDAATVSNRGAAHIVFGGQSLGATADLANLQDGTKGFRLLGEAASDAAGSSVSGIGDINGDGVDDFIVGARGAEGAGNNAGEAYVIFGKSSGSFSSSTLPPSSSTDGFTLNGISGNVNVGRTVSALGDVNNDGIDDFLVASSAGAGEAFVVFGGQTFGTAINLSDLGGAVSGSRIAGLSSNDFLSFREVRQAGDVNGDGIADIIIGSPRGDNGGSDSGETYVVFGSASTFGSTFDLSTLNGTNGFVVNGDAVNTRSGTSVSGAGDVNGDGFDDIIIGAPGYSSEGSSVPGNAFVLFGKASGFGASVNLTSLTASDGIKFVGPTTTYADAGYSVSAAGDVDGDGFDDVAIGLPYVNIDPNTGGKTFVIFGGEFGGTVTNLGTTGAESFTGTTAAEVMIGGQGNDTLAGGGGADALRGGLGNDILGISDTTFRRLDGGAGNSDSLRLDGAGLTLDLTTIGDEKNSRHRTDRYVGVRFCSEFSNARVLRCVADIGYLKHADRSWRNGRRRPANRLQWFVD